MATVKTIYGFAKEIASRGQVEEISPIKMYNLAIENMKDETGVISNPEAYAIARKKYLEPYADDIDVQLKISQSINDEKN